MGVTGEEGADPTAESHIPRTSVTAWTNDSKQAFCLQAEKALLPWGELEVRDQTALPRDCSHFPESKEME